MTLGETSDEPLYISKEKFFKIKKNYGAPTNGDISISAVEE